MGGATGTYFIPSPYHTECEWALHSVTAIGALASRANFVVGTKNPTPPTLTTNGGDSFGNIVTSGADNNNALQAFVGSLVATAPMIGFDSSLFMPMPSPSYVYATVSTPASTEVLITIMFRRKLDRGIPDKPRQKPQTHTHVRHGQYRNMMQGFAAQYPEEGKPYVHQPPEPQDTGMARHGVMPMAPLAPTQVKHRGMGKGKP